MRPHEFRLTGPQSAAFRALKPLSDINLPWGRGCGKSWFERFATWYLGITFAGVPRLELLRRFGMTVPDESLVPGDLCGIRTIWLMPTLKQFRAVHGMQFREEAELYAAAIEKTNWSDYLIQLKGGGWIQPFPAELHRSQSARGLRCDAVVADECDDILQSVFSSIVRPWFSEPWSLKIRITGGTPRQGRHGLLYARHKAGLDASQERYKSFFATYKDCPELVDAREVEDARRHTVASVFAREWECDFDSAEGLVYPFDESFHVREVPQGVHFAEYIIGCDHGWTDPGVLLLIGIYGHGNDSVAWVLDEIYVTEKPEDWWIQQAISWEAAVDSSNGQPGAHTLRARARNPVMACDRSRPDRIRGYINAGLNAVPADNRIDPGVARVANLLFRERVEAGEDRCRLFVRPCCVNTIAEFNSYKRKPDPKEPDRYTEDIIDRSNHAMDALRYACITKFGPLSYGRHEAPGA